MLRVYPYLLSMAVAIWLIVLPSKARATAGATGSVDYAAVSREIHGFEAVVNKALTAAFSGAPFALQQQTKGVYLQGYGTTFSFVVNIHRALVTPFGVVGGQEVTPEQKRRRIEDLKERLSKILFDNGNTLRQLHPGDAITIVGFIEDRNFPEELNQNKTVVLSVLKKDLDGIMAGENGWKEFKSRIKTVEY